jgi:hypothetical protein
MDLLSHEKKSKPPTQTQKFKTLQKLILSHFHNIIHLFSQITEEETLRLSLTESAKLIPYIISARKSVKAYLKVCLITLPENCIFIKYDMDLEMSGIVVNWYGGCTASGLFGGSSVGNVPG